MELFEKLKSINNLINEQKEPQAREELIKVLSNVEKPYSPLLNHLLREVGLYPYIDNNTADWKDNFVCEVFKVNVGETEEKVLHREQGAVLKELLNGNNIILSAPTSFGKSFIIDALISIKLPSTVLIIVPTIALMDETRRRLTNKFANTYKIITTPNEDVEGKSILIFPQERLFGYLNVLKSIDLFIVDEFYKVSKDFDTERSDILLKAIMKAGEKSKQRYFLCPNIQSIKDIENNQFAANMKFLPELNFNTVATNIVDYSNEIRGTPEQKKEKKTEILNQLINDIEEKNSESKTLIYAGSYSCISTICNILKEQTATETSHILEQFSNWLRVNYSDSLDLVDYVLKGIGIHNGQLHRSLTQLQTWLFNSNNDGLKYIVSTSSLIQGVNTAAENVIMWQRRNGKSNLKPLDFKNLMGRSGRMFKHFIGNVYLLDKPIKEKETTLQLEFSDNTQIDIDTQLYEDYLSVSKKEKIKSLKIKFTDLLGVDSFDDVINKNSFKSSNWAELYSIAKLIKEKTNDWLQLRWLNSETPTEWRSSILHILFSSKVMKEYNFDYTKFTEYIILASNNWNNTLNEQLNSLKRRNIDINEFFRFERKMTFDFSSLVNDINILQKHIMPNENIDISSFATKLSYAFLPPCVYYLEEYGLPRTISKKIANSSTLDLISTERKVSEVLKDFISIGQEHLIENVQNLDSFDKKIIRYFYSGITVEKGVN